MEYAIFTAVLVIVSLVSWAIGVRMGANAAVARIIAEASK